MGWTGLGMLRGNWGLQGTGREDTESRWKGLTVNSERIRRYKRCQKFCSFSSSSVTNSWARDARCISPLRRLVTTPSNTATYILPLTWKNQRQSCSIYFAFWQQVQERAIEASRAAWRAAQVLVERYPAGQSAGSQSCGLDDDRRLGYG